MPTHIHRTLILTLLYLYKSLMQILLDCQYLQNALPVLAPLLTIITTKCNVELRREECRGTLNFGLYLYIYIMSFPFCVSGRLIVIVPIVFSACFNLCINCTDLYCFVCQYYDCWLVLTLRKLPIQKSEITGVISLLLTNQLVITLFSLLVSPREILLSSKLHHSCDLSQITPQNMLLPILRTW